MLFSAVFVLLSCFVLTLAGVSGLRLEPQRETQLQRGELVVVVVVVFVRLQGQTSDPQLLRRAPQGVSSLGLVAVSRTLEPLDKTKRFSSFCTML